MRQAETRGDWGRGRCGVREQSAAGAGHTMPGDSSTSSVVFKSGTITTQPHSHVGMRICWSLKLSKAKFCTVAKIRGEIRKHLKCVIWVFTP